MDSVIIAVLPLLMLAAILLMTASDRRAKTQERRLRHLERKVDLLLAHAGIAEPEHARMAEIDQLLREGKTIQAIKVHREVTGDGLAEAKAAVERRMR
ncbi:hypothetical protein [Streptomyces sp. NPDC058773]|uniref:hypothetical protein n=1 Tax=Streptomyces sp. NPDC058773 TaxID=3346632 RepID=UPI0036C77691